MTATSTPRTLYDKIWESHLVHEKPGEASVLYIDRHLVHEVTSAQAFEGLREAGRRARRPELTLAVADHNVPTTNRKLGISDPESALSVKTLENNAREFGIEYFGMDDIRQGIVHIIGPEQGWTLPGLTIVCGDLHTATHGAFGALAFGIGTSEVEHVLATQTLMTSRSKNMRVNVTGTASDRHPREGHHPRHHQQDRHGRRHRLCHRICRRHDPRAFDGRADDDLQHVDRRRRPRGPHRRRRDHVRLHPRTAARAQGRGMGSGDPLLAHAEIG